MMKALIQDGFGEPNEVLQVGEVKRPILKKPNHVLVRVHASSVNTPDWAGTLGIPRILRPIFGGIFCNPRNRIMGSDVAGVVEEVGAKVTHVGVGDEVFGSTGDWLLGAFAEYALVPSDNLIKKPAGVSMEAAAGAVMSGLTARAAIFEAAKIESGQHILINGASGSIGTLCIQMAKSKGGTVTAVCSGRNTDMVKSLGADHVIDYTKEDFTSGETKYDMILDNVLTHSYAESQKALKPGGFVIPNSIGNDESEFWGSIPMFLWKKPRNSPIPECNITKQNLQEVIDLVASKKVKVVIDRVFPLDAAPDAIAHMASRRARGQVIIKMV